MNGSSTVPDRASVNSPYFQLVSLAVLALAIWIRADSSFEAELRRNIKREDDPEPLSGIKSDMRTGVSLLPD